MRALLSVTNKTNLPMFGRELMERGYQLISTGRTGRELAAAGIPFTPVEEVTGFPEMMDGRLKTIHPLIAGALLGRRGVDDAIMQQFGIVPIDLCVVNLYAFEKAKAGGDHAETVEAIDIGGPSLICAASKNCEKKGDPIPVVDPNDYPLVLRELAEHDGDISPALRADCRAKGFRLVGKFYTSVGGYFIGEIQKGTNVRSICLDETLFTEEQRTAYCTNLPRYRGAEGVLTYELEPGIWLMVGKDGLEAPYHIDELRVA